MAEEISSTLEQLVSGGRAIRPAHGNIFTDFLALIGNIKPEEFSRELILGCLAIGENHDLVISAFLAKMIDLPVEQFPIILEISVFQSSPAAFLRTCKALTRRGFSDEKLIDTTLAIICEHKKSPEVVFEGFKLLGLIGGISDDHLAKVRDRGHDLRKIARNFPMPEWLNIVAWNL